VCIAVNSISTALPRKKRTDDQLGIHRRPDIRRVGSGAPSKSDRRVRHGGRLVPEHSFQSASARVLVPECWSQSAGPRVVVPEWWSQSGGPRALLLARHGRPARVPLRRGLPAPTDAQRRRLIAAAADDL